MLENVRLQTNKTKAVMLAVLLSLVVILAAFLLTWQMLQHTRSELEQQLNSTLDSSITQVKQELNKHMAIVRYWADSADLLFAAVVQMQNKPRTHRADSINLLDELLLASLEQLNYRDYKIVNKHGEILASGSGHDIGDKLPSELKQTLELAWLGIPQVSRPFAASRAWKNIDGWKSDHLTTMMAFSVLVDNRGNSVALLAFEIDPDVIFNPLFHHAWLGKSGETYGINREGILLTQSKFGQQLQDIGLIENGPTKTSALVLKATDPGINLVENPSFVDKIAADRPLTVMAQSLSQGEDGSNVVGYADYRGVPVIGAWRWDDELQMGIVTEVEMEEAFYLYNSTLKSLPLGVLSIIMTIFAAAFLYIWANNKTHRIQQQRDAILNQTADGIITIDSKGSLLVVNPAASNIFGYNTNELVGQNVSMLMPEPDRSAHDGYLARSSLKESKVMNLTRELRGARKDGGVFPLELTVSPMILEDEKYFVGVIRDVTERHQQQQDLIAAKVEAEHAKEVAENANRAKSEFLSRMSHELRTPLNAILGFSQLLLVDSLTEDQADSVNLINSSGKHLLNLINDVLDLARIESGKMTVSIEKVNVRDLINDIMPVIETQLDSLELTMTSTCYTEDEVWVKADYLKLKQVLLNILSNAVKYNRQQGHIGIEISMHNKRSIRISIIDSGYGISTELQAGLFEPFNRLGQDRTEIQGTGIGLVISRELVRLMQGDMGLSSKMGIGSTFWVEFPLVENSLQQEDVETDEYLLEQEQDLAEQDKLMKVLYIEDNPANMTLVRQLFERFPRYQLIEAETAELGLDMARQQRPDIVLLDINLPEMNGFEALSIMKAEGLTEEMQVIALSANALVSEVERGYKAGFNFYLTKPIDFRRLLETLHDVFEGKQN